MVAAHIANYLLEPRDVVACERVCRAWRAELTQPCVYWKRCMSVAWELGLIEQGATLRDLKRVVHEYSTQRLRDINRRYTFVGATWQPVWVRRSGSSIMHALHCAFGKLRATLGTITSDVAGHITMVEAPVTGRAVRIELLDDQPHTDEVVGNMLLMPLSSCNQMRVVINMQSSGVDFCLAHHSRLHTVHGTVEFTQLEALVEREIELDTIEPCDHFVFIAPHSRLRSKLGAAPRDALNRSILSAKEYEKRFGIWRHRQAFMPRPIQYTSPSLTPPCEDLTRLHVRIVYLPS